MIEGKLNEDRAEISIGIMSVVKQLGGDKASSLKLMLESNR